MGPSKLFDISGALAPDLGDYIGEKKATFVTPSKLAFQSNRSQEW